MPDAKRITWACTVGLLCLAGAFGMAAQHPLAPVVAVLILALLAGLAWWRPGVIWCLLPALLPVANFTPWTGWWLWDESDLLLLCLLGGAYLRWGLSAPPPAPGPMPGRLRWICALLWLCLALGVWRGLADARGSASWSGLAAVLWQQGFYGDYDLPGNTLRVVKSMAWSLLLLPVLYRWSLGGGQRLARGMVAGLALVCAVVLWERGVYADGVLFSQHYRTSAWFWEMHVGGAAIDVYLALALPFAWWAAWVAPHGVRWVAAASLLVLAVYAVLTTYARGVYFCAGLSLLALMVLAYRHGMVSPDRSAWHRRAMAGLFAVVVLEAVSALLGGGFMSQRLAHTGADLSQRWVHWQRGLALLQTPAQWWLGLGIGRLPAHYSTQAAAGGLPGRVRWQTGPEGGTVAWLSGPQGPQVGGTLALAQRVPLQGGGPYRLRLQLEAPTPVVLQARLCAQHLLYPLHCQERTLTWTGARTGSSPWLMLTGAGWPAAYQGPGAPWGVLSLTVVTAGAAVGLHAVELMDPAGSQVLKNTGFSFGHRYWSTVADGNFLPWHIDNLLLELLIERGGLGVVLFAAITVWSLVLARQGVRRRHPLALILGVSIAAALVLGLVVSFIEIPRVCLILCLLWMALPWVPEEMAGGQPAAGGMDVVA